MGLPDEVITSSMYGGWVTLFVSKLVVELEFKSIASVATRSCVES